MLCRLPKAVTEFATSITDDEYLRVEPDADGIIASEQLPGLRLHVHSMLAGDLAAVLAALGPPPTV